MKSITIFALGLAACNPSVRAPSVTAPIGNQRPALVLAPASAAAPPSAPPAVVPTCVPLQGQVVETQALHRLVEEKTEWKSPSLMSGEPKHIRLLGFNDFHGQLSPPPPIEGRPVGGAAVLAAYFRAAAAETKDATIAVHAGDMIGASPPASALNQDEPTVLFMGTLLGTGCSRSTRTTEACHVVASLGNHEFDEGVTEFRRILEGGNHKRGPFLGHNYPGAPFPYIGGNVHEKATGKSLVAPYLVKTVAGVKVGFIGAVLQGSPVFLMPSGIKDVTFDDEVEAVNGAAEALSKQGVHALVVVIHQGAHQCFAPGVPHDEHSVAGPLVDIVKKLHPDIDVVVSGHTHSVLSALIPNRGGTPTLVTQGFHATTGFAQIELTVDSGTGDILEKQARIVTPWADVAPGNSPAPDVAALVAKAEESVRKQTTKVVGTVESTVHAPPDAAGNSEMGNLLTDAQRDVTGADIAFTTPSWVRGDIAPGAVSWGELFRVQPFGNRLMKLSLTGTQIIELLNEQWTPEDHPRILHVSGLTYSWDAAKDPKNRVLQVLYAGKPIIPDKHYTVVMNEYLAEGGDAFTVLEALRRTPTRDLDIDALERYVKKESPIRPNSEKRIERLH